MQRIDGELVLSPTDLTKHLACAHVTTLDLAVADGVLRAPVAADDTIGLVASYGMAHEKAYLSRLVDEGRHITEIPTAYDGAGRRVAEAATLAAMRAGVDVIYQGTFFDGAWGGQADFLLRVDRPSALGEWSYDLADTKLARRLKVPALLQMATYAQRLSVLQGVDPRWLHVVTGDGRDRSWRLLDVAAYARRARAGLRTALEHPQPTDAVPVAHCVQCRWSAACAAEWQERDDLSLVAGLRADHRTALRRGGVSTMAGLAESDPARLGLGPGAAARLVQQARLQVAERESGVASYDLLPPTGQGGLCRLPRVDPGDLYLDFEGDPYAAEGRGREYLAGVGDRSGGFTALWAHDADAEKRLTSDLVDHLLAHWRAHPGMHVYHYAPYETAALKRLTGRHGVREAELDQLLRGERFVDLYGVVRQGLRVSKPSYSIKYLEHFYWGRTRSGGAVSGAMDSVVAYERWLGERDPQTLADIEAYNRDDVASTLALHDWLEDRRTEAAAQYGPMLRPGGTVALPEQPVGVAELAETALAETVRAQGDPLLAALVQWHRREARPAWWDVFRLSDLADTELIDDASALGGVGAPEFVRPHKRSAVYRYRFPVQDTKIGNSVLDVDTGKNVGDVLDRDLTQGWLELRVGPGKAPPRPRGLGPEGPLNDAALRASIAWVAQCKLSGQDSAGARLLDRVVPAELRRAGETPAQAVVRAGRGLSGQVLAVQGPPGSGKTTVAAELIRALLADGKRVGVTATSHAVIGNLLGRVGQPAVQKCTPEQHCGSADVVAVDSNAAVLAALDAGVSLIGGTAWLWAREDMRGAVDVLVIDEAGQFSLANAVAVAGGTTSLVLLGDPQQLTQPTQAQHPDGGHVSALRHLIGGHDTIRPERGVFLDTTWRMHPQINRFVSDLSYDGRLVAGPDNGRQRVQAPGRLSGAGLRFLPVVHTGNAAQSVQEAQVAAALVADLLCGTWTDCAGAAHQITLADVLVVTPYNAQVAALLAHLPAGARVGTVDKFQGQEAPVVVYSMASSSAADAPRGVEFLYDLHRLNVAVSRARAMAVVVASPALLDAAVHSPEQLRKVNALCRLAELATPDAGCGDTVG